MADDSPPSPHPTPASERGSSGTNTVAAANEELAETILEEAINNDPAPVKMYKIAKKGIAALFAWFNCRHRRAERQRQRELSALDASRRKD